MKKLKFFKCWWSITKFKRHLKKIFVEKIDVEIKAITGESDINKAGTCRNISVSRVTPDHCKCVFYCQLYTLRGPAKLNSQPAILHKLFDAAFTLINNAIY